MSSLRNASAIREMSVISLSEIAIKRAIGKLQITEDQIMQGIADLQLRLLPYGADHAFRLFTLPLHHSDPFDRQIIAALSVAGVYEVSLSSPAYTQLTAGQWANCTSIALSQALSTEHS